MKNAPANVFFLHFEDEEEKYFYWMQEPDQEGKYQQILEGVKGVIEFDPESLSQGNPPGVQENPVQESLPKVEESKEESTPQKPTTQPPPTSAERRQSLTEDFLKALGQMATPVTAPSLSTVFTTEYLRKMSEDPDAIALLSEHLPENQSLPENLSSPQFRQALDTLEQVPSIIKQALRSEDGMNIFRSLGFDASYLNNTMDRTNLMINKLWTPCTGPSVVNKLFLIIEIENG